MVNHKTTPQYLVVVIYFYILAGKEVQVRPPEGSQHPYQRCLGPVEQSPTGQASQAEGPVDREGSRHGQPPCHGNQAGRPSLLQGPGCKEACGKILLKTHTCDNLWVCSTETNSSSPIPDSMSLRYIAECGSNRSKRQAHNLKIWMVTSDLPWTVSHVRLPIEPALVTFSKMAHGKELGESSLKG